MRATTPLILALLFPTCAIARPATFECPKVIDIQQTVTGADSAWERVPDTGLLPASLMTIAVYTGHPSESGSLVPDSNKRNAQAEVTIWRLPRDSAPYWMACVYANSRTLLAKQIPAEAKQCSLTTALRGQQANGVVSFVCE